MSTYQVHHNRCTLRAGLRLIDTNPKSLEMQCNSQARFLVRLFRHAPPHRKRRFVSVDLGFCGIGKQSLKTSHNKKSRGFLLCLFPACTLPQALCQPQTYCSAATVPTQAAPASVAVPERNTASSNEQKKRTPVWFATCGSADAW